MDQCDETGILYISGYYHHRRKILGHSGRGHRHRGADGGVYPAQCGGTPFDGHVGGVAVSEDTLYVSGQKQNGLYTICAIPLKDLPAEGSHEVKLEQTHPGAGLALVPELFPRLFVGGKFLPPGQRITPSRTA